MTAPRFARPITDPALIAEWKAYEFAAHRAAVQYLLIPISLGIAGGVTYCACGKRTESKYGTCMQCLRAQREGS